MAGLTLPIESHVLQAFVSEAIKPVLDVVLTYGAGHFYVSQSDKGGLVFGGAIDGYNTYGQRGTLPMAEEVALAAVTLLPGLARVKVLRQWGGVMDMSMDGSPIISKTRVDGLDPQRRLVLRRLQGHPGRRHGTAHLIARGTPASARRASGPGPLRGRADAGRARRRAVSVRALRPRDPCCESPVPGAVSATKPSFAIAAMRASRARRRMPDSAAFTAYVYERDNPRGWHLGMVAARRRLPPAAESRASHTDATRSAASARRTSRHRRRRNRRADASGRLASRDGLLTDAARPLGFRFDGRPLQGLAGDTLASALLANGTRVVGRSFKYHRPRGIVTAGAGRAVRAGRRDRCRRARAEPARHHAPLYRGAGG